MTEHTHVPRCPCYFRFPFLQLQAFGNLLAGSWAVVNKQGIVVRVPVNTPQVFFLPAFGQKDMTLLMQGRDPHLPGWVKVQSGQVILQLYIKEAFSKQVDLSQVLPPAPSLVLRGLHLTTHSCTKQQFEVQFF